MASPYFMTTERLGFRPYTLADTEDLREVFADPDARRFYPDWEQADRAERWITCNLQRYAGQGFGLWALELRGSGRFVGDAGLTLQPVAGEDRLEIGYHILGDLRGRGLATEAALACLDFGFSRLQPSPESLCSIVHPDNRASVAVAGRVHASESEFSGGHGSMRLFSTTCAQWRHRPNSALQQTSDHRA